MDNREDVGQYYPGGTVVPAKPEPASHPIESVNGKAGAVVLTAEDVGALPATTEIPDAEKVSAWGFLKKAWSDLVAAFAAKTHRHTIGQVDGLQSELSTLDQKATEASDLAAAAQSTANSANETAAAAMDKANELDTAKADKSALATHVNNKDNPHAVTPEQIGAYSKGETDATVERIDADIETASAAAGSASSAAAEALTKAELAQTAANAANDKADAANEALVGKLDKTAVVAPSASATAGQAADAKAVDDALGRKAPSNITTASDDKIRIVYGDNVWWIVPLGIYYWNDGEAGEHAHSPTAIFALPTSAHDSSFALTSDIEDAVKDKADITAIRTAVASLDAAKSSIADIINALKGI